VVCCADADIAGLSNRLAKNAATSANGRAARAFTCYRLYDRDVPEFPLTVDWYEARVHLQEVDTAGCSRKLKHALC